MMPENFHFYRATCIVDSISRDSLSNLIIQQLYLYFDFDYICDLSDV